MRDQHQWFVSRQSIKLYSIDKEAFVIYISVKKLSFNLGDVSITLGNDNLPLKRFLQKKTFDAIVND